MSFKKCILFIFILLATTININATETKDIYERAPLSEEPIQQHSFAAKPRGIFNLDTYYIYNLDDWSNLVSISKNANNGVIKLMNDIDFSNYEYQSLIINDNVIFDGNGYTLKNIKGSIPFIHHNYGKMINTNFDKINLQGDSFLGVFRNSYGIIDNLNFSNINITSLRYVGVIARNYGTINNVSLINSTIIGDEYVGGIAGVSSSNPERVQLVNKEIKNIFINNIKINNIKLYSNKSTKSSSYRNIDTTGKKDYMGDHFGAIVGRLYNSSINNASVANILIKGDDYLGGAIGTASFDKKANTQVTKLNNIKISNFKAYGGKRVGGVIGYIVDYTNLMHPAKMNHTKICAILSNSTVSGAFYINGYSELGGAIGLNYSAKVDNVKVSAKRVKYNIYSYYDEAAGLVGDNEFGYIAKSSTNLNVYAKVFQAASLVADNEGLIISSTAYGHAYAPKEIGGFVGSNLGIIKNSIEYGNVYSTTRIKVKKYKKVKYKKKVKYRKKGKIRYKYVKRTKKKKYYTYLPLYSGNFSAYNGSGKYKNFKLKGSVYNSSYKGKRYLKSKKIANYKYGAYGK